jgi:hypothetical protein
VLPPEKRKRLKEAWERAHGLLTAAIVKDLPGVNPGQIFVRAGHVATACVGEWLMLWWIYGLDRDEAWESAIGDMLEVGISSINAETFIPFGKRASTFLVQFIRGSGHKLIDVTDAGGCDEARRRRRQTDIVGYKTETELWFWPNYIDRVLRQEELPPERVWPALADDHILLRRDRHLKLRRSLVAADLDKAQFYVLDRHALTRDVDPESETETLNATPDEEESAESRRLDL